MHTLSSGSEHTHCFGAQQRKLRTCTVISSSHLSSCAPQAQAAHSSAVGLTMPHPVQHSLIHVLLLWTTILSIIQAVFIILFFTAGHHSLSQNSSAVAPERTMQCQSPSPPSEQELLLGKGKMLTFQATEAKNKIKWIAKNPSKSLVSEEGDVLTIKKDGYYFLNLQVTLKTSSKEIKLVSLKWNSKVLLRGWINTNTSSTGLLGKVEELSAGGTLEVTIEPSTTDIDDSESLTHLDIIYMVKP